MQYLDILYGLVPPFLVSLAFITPLLGLFVKSRKFFMLYAIVVVATATVIAGIIARNIFTGVDVALYPFGGWPPPIGIAYIVDKLSASLALLASIIVLLSVVASTSYLENYKPSTLSYIYTAVLGFTAGVMGVFYTGDIFNLFVMMEVMCISLYVLVAFHRTRAEAVEAAIKYSLVSIVALVLYFFSTLLIYGSYQTLNMADLAIKSRPSEFGYYQSALLSGGYFADIRVTTAIAMAIIIWVFTLESALFPNHFWLPDAISEAPTPVSAVLPVAEMASTYVVIRYLFTIFGPDSILAENGVRSTVLYVLLALGVVASIVGGVMMALQRDAKRLLGYSSISHVGFIYMALGLTAFSQEGRLPLMAAIFHMVNYVVTSSMLFLAVGALEKASGSRDIDALAGVGRYMPVAGTSVVLGVLNLVGLPPLGGFFSKLMIYQAALEVSQPVIALMVILATAISVMGYAKLLLMVFGTGVKGLNVKEDMRFSLPGLLLAVILVLLGTLLPVGLYEYLEDVCSAMYGYKKYIEVFLAYMASLLGR
ncbi:MAG: proton-conducting transporter membrane subunit [Desulfurococcaceae archaeon]